MAQVGLVPVEVKGYQLLFRSNDVNNNPLAAVTTIMVPMGAATDRLLAYSIAEDPASTKCAPSYYCT